jgi:hypothetical protein
MSRSSTAERYGYYRRCQRIRENGEQCKAPAMKDEAVCYKHGQRAEMERRKAAMRAKFVLPPLRDLRTVQKSIGDVANAMIENRIDEDYAGELLQQLERASVALRSLGR